MKIEGVINLGETQFRLLTMYASAGYNLSVEKHEMLLDNLDPDHYFMFVKRTKEGYVLTDTYFTLRALGILKP